MAREGQGGAYRILNGVRGFTTRAYPNPRTDYVDGAISVRNAADGPIYEAR